MTTPLPGEPGYKSLGQLSRENDRHREAMKQRLWHKHEAPRLSDAERAYRADAEMWR